MSHFFPLYVTALPNNQIAKTSPDLWKRRSQAVRSLENERAPRVSRELSEELFSDPDYCKVGLRTLCGRPHLLELLGKGQCDLTVVM